MKKTALIFLLMSITLSTINAQETSSSISSQDLRKKLLLGVKVGANYSNVYDAQQQSFNADGKFGLVAGGFISIPLGKYIGVQPELLFSQKGFKATGSSVLTGSYSFTRTTSFIDVPILFVVKPTQMFSIVGGPQYSYIIKRKDEFTSGTNTAAQEQEFSNEDYRKNLLSFTGGFEFTMENTVFGIRAAWDLQSNNGDGTSTTPRYKNVWYQATIGIRF